MQTLNCWSGSAPALRVDSFQPRSQTRAPPTIQSQTGGSYDEFLFPRPKFPPFVGTSLFLLRKVCACFPPTFPDQAGWWGRGGWERRRCLRVIDMDVCRDGADEPNQFPTRDHSNPTVPLGEPARWPESPRGETGAVAVVLLASGLGGLSGLHRRVWF